MIYFGEPLKLLSWHRMLVTMGGAKALFLVSLTKMYGEETMSNVVGSLNREIKFYGLTITSMNLEGLDKHLRLIDSYKKLHQARAKAFATFDIMI